MAYIDETGKISFVNQLDNFSQEKPIEKGFSNYNNKERFSGFFSERSNVIKDNWEFHITPSVSSEVKTASVKTAISRRSSTEIISKNKENYELDKRLLVDDMFATTTEENILGQFKDAKNSGKKGFKDKKKAFLSKTDFLFGITKEEDNEAAISNFDDKVSTLLMYQGRKHEDKAAYIKSELKAIQKMSKGNTGNDAVISKKKSPFINSSYEFTDKKKQFKSPFADRFRLLGKDSLGNDLFLPNRKDAIQVTALIIQKKFGESDKDITEENKPNLDIESKFGSTTVRDNDSKSKKSVDSYFSNNSEQKKKTDNQSKFTTNEDKYKKANEQRKTTKKEYSKETKKAASIAAVSNFLKTKKIIQNQLSNMSGEVTGDLVKGGAGFLQVIIQSLLEVVKAKFKAVVISAFASFFGFLSSLISAISPLLVIVITVIIITTSFFSIFTDGVDVPMGDGYTYASLSEDEIDDIIENLYFLYPDMSYEQEVLLDYSLSKVGCEYNQNYHWSLTEDIFDCSSLAYRSYLEIGVIISNQGIYSAAEECRMVVEGLNVVTGGELAPGDLIFYGGSDNDRYMGVYHVAIYVGDGKMVEARGTSWGVVYCDVRTSNAVAYGRYV